MLLRLGGRFRTPAVGPGPERSIQDPSRSPLCLRIRVEERVPRIRSPRLEDPAQASQFEMEVSELPEGRSNVGQ